MQARGWIKSAKLVLCAAVAGCVITPRPLLAQSGGMPPSLFSTTPSAGATTLGPVGGAPGASLISPGGGVVSPSLATSPLTLPPSPPGQATSAAGGQVTLALAARFGRELPAINADLDWRIYTGQPDQQGAFRLVKEDKSAAPTMALPPGSYVVHCAFGLASAVKAVVLRAEPVKETFEIPAGGLRLEGRVGGVAIPAGQISFDVFAGSQFDGSEKPALAQGIQTGQLVLLPEGTYHIVSNYGDTNAVVRSDIRVQAGKLTDVSVTHRAAIVTLKLVSEKGGDPLANTAWSVLTPGGDVIKESIGAFPRVILAEGDYRVIARNEGRVFERAFKVITGVDGEVELLAK